MEKIRKYSVLYPFCVEMPDRMQYNIVSVPVPGEVQDFLHRRSPVSNCFILRTRSGRGASSGLAAGIQPLFHQICRYGKIMQAEGTLWRRRKYP